MIYSDKNMRKIKRSSKHFVGKKKAPWKKSISKKKNIKKNFPPKRKKIF